MLSFAIMDDRVLRVGRISFEVLQRLGPGLTPEASFVLNRERVRHAAYAASRRMPQPSLVNLDLACFGVSGPAADAAARAEGVSPTGDGRLPGFRVA